MSNNNENEFNHLKISHNIPLLGEINAYICAGYGVACYNYLNSESYIQRLKKTSQLGIIENTQYGTHHTRWEYVVLQLYLINQFQNIGNKYINQFDEEDYRIKHLSSNIKGFNSDCKITGASLLQIWVLLFNSGHLEGTFASERGVFKSIKKNKSLKDVFLNGLPDFLITPFEESLKNNQINHVHKFLISFLINKENKNKNSISENNVGDSDLIQILLESIKFYFSYDDEKINSLRFIFNKIRQISYLFLDSQYASLPLTFNISKILINPKYYFNELMIEDSPLNRTLNSFDTLLSYTLYYSEDSIRELGIHSMKIYERYHNLHFTLSNFRHEFSKPHSYLNSSLNISTNQSLHLIFEHPDILFSKIFYNYLNMSMEDEWNKILSEKNNILTIQTYFQNHFTVINLNFVGGNNYNHILATSRLMNLLIETKNKIISFFDNQDLNNLFFESIVDSIFNNAFEKIFLFILNNSIDHNLYCEFDKKKDKHFNVIDIFNKKDIEKQFNKINTEKLDKSEINELNMNKKFIEENIKRSCTLFSFSSIRIYSFEEKRVLRELDGCFMIFKKQKLHIGFVEAKKQKSRSISNSKNALKITIKNLKIPHEFKGLDEDYHGACYKLILKNKFL